MAHEDLSKISGTTKATMKLCTVKGSTSGMLEMGKNYKFSL